MAAADCMPDLPDDLLRRILYFVAAKEGASTAVLSRRWRSLWRTSGAVNLDTRSYVPLLDDLKREKFLQDALAALEAHGPVRKLSFHMEGSDDYVIESFVSYRPEPDESEEEDYWEPADLNLITEVMSNSATRNAEELRIAGVVGSNYTPSYRYIRGGYYSLSIDILPMKALRVLHIVNARLEGDWTDVSFPRLNSLLLHGCHLSLEDVQDMIHGAPQLTAVQLESIYILFGWYDDDDESNDTNGKYSFHICGPEVTTLVLTDWSCRGDSRKMEKIELDMPKLKYFRYQWFDNCQVSLKSPACNLTGVDFHIKDSIDTDKVVESFWHFLRNFSNAKVLKLKLDCLIDQIAVVDNKCLDELLDNKLLYNLQHLEVEGCYRREKDTVTWIAIANLFHCCPIVRDLRLRIKGKQGGRAYSSSHIACKTRLDFDKSVENFEQHRRRRRGSNDGDKYEASDIRGLSEHPFNCLQSCVKRVSLQFRNKEEESFFGIQLAKFLAENAMVLEEMQIDDGNCKLCEHLNAKVRIWALNAAKKRNRPATDIRVLTYEQ